MGEFSLEAEADRLRALDLPRLTRPVVAVVMGVSGSGKTTICKLLAQVIGCPFQEGDDLHPAANVEKMRRGTPLNDADRQPWLEKIAAVIDGWLSSGASGVVACSALKRQYRETLIGARGRRVALIYLKGSHDLIAERMEHRHGHYMPRSLLESQFATLEEPAAAEHPIVLDLRQSAHELVAEAVRQLAARAD